MRLSNSAIDKYAQCPMKYKLHYIDRVRTEEMGSPLIFGGAIDEALNCILLRKKLELTKEESEMVRQDPYKVFLRHFRTVKIIDTEYYVPTYKGMYYYKKDLDLNLMTEQDLRHFEYVATKHGLEFANIPDFVEELRSVKFLPPDKQLFLNYVSWYSLAKKAKLLLAAYEQYVMPRVQEVHSIQREVYLPNGEGDYIIGYIDFEATMDDGVRYVLDNKTASAAYKKDSVRTSQQLTIYSEFCQNENCGYVVLNKNINKRNKPKVKVQIILDKIPAEQFEKTFDKVGEVDYNIKQKCFEPNFDSCWMYNRKCEYYRYCHAGQVDGLIKLPEEKDANKKGTRRLNQGAKGGDSGTEESDLL